MSDPVARVIEGLNELIAALDRRLPRLDGPFEADIVRDAVALRHKAVRRIEEIENRSRRSMAHTGGGARSRMSGTSEAARPGAGDTPCVLRRNPDEIAVCRWENEGGAPRTAPPRESRLSAKGHQAAMGAL